MHPDRTLTGIRPPFLRIVNGFQKKGHRIDVCVALVLAVSIGLLGLWPHLLLTHRVGSFHFFNGAYDEVTYTLIWLHGLLRSTRLLSGGAFGAGYLLCGFWAKAALVLSEFVFAFIAAIAAYYAAAQVCRRRSARLLLALLLLFGADLFSLGNLAVWHSGSLSLSTFSRLVAMWGPNLVPPYETSYLAIFRTPEPQVSFSLMFLILGLLVRFARDAAAPPCSLRAATAGLICLLPPGYTFVTLPVALIAIGCVPVFILYKRKSAAAAITDGLLGAALVILILQWWQRQGAISSTAAADLLSYSSRMPIVTPAVIASLTLGIALGAWMLLTRRGGALLFLALGCLLCPAALSNQQVVTGWMVSARDWERNASYALVVFGVAIAAAAILPAFGLRWRRMTGVLFLVCTAVVAWTVVGAQRRAIGYWMPQNVRSVAAERALKSVKPDLLARSILVFQQPDLGPLLTLRMDGRTSPLLDFYKVAITPVPNMAPDALEAPPSPHERMVFDYWMRNAIEPDQAERLVRAEVRQLAGTYTNYLFGFRDAWYPASDRRAVRPAPLERSIGPIIMRYRAFLSPSNRAEILRRPGLLVSMHDPHALRRNPWIDNKYLGKGAVGNVVVYLYRQRPK
jgi:hypothetical protein